MRWKNTALSYTFTDLKRFCVILIPSEDSLLIFIKGLNKPYKMFWESHLFHSSKEAGMTNIVKGLTIVDKYYVSLLSLIWICTFITFSIRQWRAQSTSAVPLRFLNPACSSANSYSIFSFSLLRITYKSILLMWLINYWNKKYNSFWFLVFHSKPNILGRNILILFNYSQTFISYFSTYMIIFYS